VSHSGFGASYLGFGASCLGFGLGFGAPYLCSEVSDLRPAKPEGIYKGLGLGLLHLSNLTSQKVHVLGAILTLVEYAPVAI